MKSTSKLLAISLFTIISFPLFAQVSHPHYISVNIGTNIPLEEYSEVSDIELGSADQGITYSFEAGMYLSRVFGLGFNLGVFENPLSESDMRDFIIDRGNSTFNSDNLNVSSNNWVNGYFMIGPLLSFGKEKFIIDFKLLGGVMNTSKPNMNLDNSSPIDSFTQSREVSSTALAVNYGIHFRIKLIGKLGLRINAEGFQSAQEFETIVKEFDNNGVESQATKNIEKEIMALNLGAGLAFTF